MSKKRYDVDVICLHLKDGNMVPMRIRVEDDEGVKHVYSIKSYKELSGNGTYTTSDGVFVTDESVFFECRIEINSKMRGIRLYFRKKQNNWFMTV